MSREQEIKPNRAIRTTTGRTLVLAFALAAPLGISAKPKQAPAPQKEAQTCYAEYVADAKTGQVLHARNEDAPILPASTVKPIIGLLVDDAVNIRQIRWADQIQVARPRPGPGKLRIHDTICNPDEIGRHGYIHMSVQDAFDNTIATSNLQTTLALQKYLEEKTGRTYRDLAYAKLKEIGAHDSTIIEPVGLSNAALCLNEKTRKGSVYAKALGTMTLDARLATNQNISTARDMSLWARATTSIAALTTAFHRKTVSFLGRTLRNTNPFYRQSPPVPGKRRNSIRPISFSDVDFPSKTGFTETAGSAINGILDPDHARPLTITLASCPKGGVRDQRLFELVRQFKHLTGPKLQPLAPLPNLDIYGEIADSQAMHVPFSGMTPTAE